MPPATSASRLWPLPDTPAMPKISPARSSRFTPSRTSDPFRAMIPSRRSTGSPGILRLGFRLRNGAADHQFGKFGAGDRLHGAFGHQLAGAQHGDAVADRQHFVELVGDEDDRQAVGDEPLQGIEQRGGFLRRQHRRRLIEDQDAGVAIERLQDLDALALADRERCDGGVGIDRKAEGLAQAL